MTTSEPPAAQLPIGTPTAEEVNQMLRESCLKNGQPYLDYSEVVEVSAKHLLYRNGTIWTPVCTRPKVGLAYSHVPEWRRITKVEEICKRWIEARGDKRDLIAPSGKPFNNLVLWIFEGDELKHCALYYEA